MTPTPERMARQFEFLRECERLKEVFRRSFNLHSGRRENDAEHSWAVCLFAATLAEYSDVPIDLLRVLKMLLVHDLVEIDAGDTFAYDPAAAADQHVREARAADRLFGLLPPDQAREFRGLWDEFEARATPDAKFAAAVDRLQAVALNSLGGGGTWREHGVAYPQILARNRPIGDASGALWTYARGLIEEFARHGSGQT